MGGEGRHLRVLIVEDEALIALDLEHVLRRHGHAVLGPAASVERAFGLIRDAAFDVAVLDVNLGTEEVFPIADALAARDVPFVFVTGYDAGSLPLRHAGRPVATKPFPPDQLVQLLIAIVPPAD